MQWDAGPHAGFTTGEPWLPVEPEPHRRSMSLRHRADPSLGLHPLPGTHRAAPRPPARRRRPVRAAAARPRAAVGHRARGDGGPPARSCVANCSSTPSRRMPPTCPDLAGAPTVLLATHPGPRRASTCCPWESRVYELGAPARLTAAWRTLPSPAAVRDRGREVRTGRLVGHVAGQQGRRRGTFTDGSEYETWGAGPKVLLYLPGGPGSSIPTGRGRLAVTTVVRAVRRRGVRGLGRDASPADAARARRRRHGRRRRGSHLARSSVAGPTSSSASPSAG